MAFPCLAVLMVIIVIFTIKRNQVKKKEEEQVQTFWQKEDEANKTRKQDISGLDYIKIPLSNLPAAETADDDAVLQSCRETLAALSQKPILNLSGITNTDLKLRYGAANLPYLTECDENYTQLIRCLNSLGCRLAEQSRTEEAVEVLEFAVSCKTEIGTTYTTLADLYLKQGKHEKIKDLTHAAASLKTPSRSTILEKLNIALTSFA